MGVPDSCLEAWGSLLADGLTETILRQALLQKITTIGSQSLQFFVDLAKTYGYSITIDELFNQTVLSTVLTPFASGVGWASQWRVHVYKNVGATVSRHTAIGTAEEALAWWGDSVIECVIRHYAPAHTNVIFGYFED